MASQRESTMGLESGAWEGEYIDVHGYRGRLRLDLEATTDALRGTYELTVRSEDKPQIMRGEVEGGMEGDRVRMALELGRSREKMQYEAHIRPAGSYARQALIGVVQAAPQSNFGGGVWIAWRFARPSGR